MTADVEACEKKLCSLEDSIIFYGGNFLLSEKILRGNGKKAKTYVGVDEAYRSMSNEAHHQDTNRLKDEGEDEVITVKKEIRRGRKPRQRSNLVFAAEIKKEHEMKRIAVETGRLISSLHKSRNMFWSEVKSEISEVGA